MTDFIEEQNTDSFVFISVNAQGASHAGSVRSSVDGWSEISCPGSAKSTNSHTRRSSNEAFSVFSGTYLQNPINAARSVTGTSDKGYYVVNSNGGCASQENGPVFSSNSTTFTNEKELQQRGRANGNGNPLHAAAAHPQPNNNASIGSVGSRVPFSWAEITKIQPRFHHEADDDAKSHGCKPKVFDAPTKIATRHSQAAINAPQRKSPSPSPGASNASSSPKPTTASKRVRAARERAEAEEEIPMPSISETDPYATKGDLGRRMRRGGKRGSRLKYPNGKRGGKANKNVRRKKNQK